MNTKGNMRKKRHLQAKLLLGLFCNGSDPAGGADTCHYPAVPYMDGGVLFKACFFSGFHCGKVY